MLCCNEIHVHPRHIHEKVLASALLNIRAVVTSCQALASESLTSCPLQLGGVSRTHSSTYLNHSRPMLFNAFPAYSKCCQNSLLLAPAGNAHAYGHLEHTQQTARKCPSP
jgi:hypothetical protein